MSGGAKQGGPAPSQRLDRMIQEAEHDPYKVRKQLPDPTACPECGAMYRDGRWVWGAPPVGANEYTCPACQRARDGQPAGILTLEGDFLKAHREEILGLARNVEEREKGQHPLKRILELREEGGDDGPATVITTADPGLARNIGDAVESAYEGDLEIQYSEGEHLVRVYWRR